LLKYNFMICRFRIESICLYACLLAVFVFSRFDLHAEGTKTASPTSGTCSALALLPSRQNGAYLGCVASNRIYFHIANYKIERLYFGFNWQQYNGGRVANMFMRIYSPDGSLACSPIKLSVSGAGYIDSYAQAITGPRINNSNPSGYSPLYFEPKSNGEYWVEFYRSNDNGNTQTTSEVWSYSPYFDFTVGTPSGDIFPGRIHCGKWGFVAIEPKSFKNIVSSKASPILYPLTDDGVVYKISFEEGFEPIDFNVAMTSYGVSNTGNWLEDRKSRNDLVSPPLLDGYPIFLNPPDSTVYRYASLPSVPQYASPAIIGCYPGPYLLRFFLSQEGDCRIFVELNGEDGFQEGTTDRLIDLPGCKKGFNVYKWDGKDGLGEVVPADTPISVSLVFDKGRGNLPIYDAEINKGGINIACIAPAEIDHMTIFWDDSGLTKMGGLLKNAQNNLTGPGIDNSAIGTQTPAHAWNGDGNPMQFRIAPAVKGNDNDNYQANDFGNARTINSWFWGVELTSEIQLSTTCLSIEGSVRDYVSRRGTDAGGLYVSLVDSLTQSVISYAAVAQDGSFVLDHCPKSGRNMLLQLSVVKPEPGENAPVASLPTGWMEYSPISQRVTTSDVNLTGCVFNISKEDGSTISGIIRNRVSGMPVSGATVFLLDNSTGQVVVRKTDARGSYSFTTRTPFSGVLKATADRSTVDCRKISLKSKNKSSVELYSQVRYDFLLDDVYVGKVWRYNNIHYDVEKWDIRPDAQIVLDSVVLLMKSLPITIELSSHTDMRGTTAYNDVLSQKRAESAKAYLVQRGIDPSRIQAKGYGLRFPIAQCKDWRLCTEAEHQMNRRTEVKVMNYTPFSSNEVPRQVEYNDGEILDATALPDGFFAPCK
jgi:outer membrane protein OmpA-like peptidoglycan-associated protein